MNEYNIVFLSDEEGKVYVEIGVYGTNNQPKKGKPQVWAKGGICIGVAKAESK